MIQFAMVDSVIKARDAGTQMFTGSLGVSLGRICMFGDTFAIVSFDRRLSVFKCFRHVAFSGISAKRGDS
jgi:hypothetical protein